MVDYHPEKRSDGDSRIELAHCAVSLTVENVFADKPVDMRDKVAEEPRREFVFFECFTDEAAQQRHQNMPYHVAMSAAGWACLDGQPVIEFLRPASR